MCNTEFIPAPKILVLLRNIIFKFHSYFSWSKLVIQNILLSGVTNLVANENFIYFIKLSVQIFLLFKRKQ